MDSQTFFLLLVAAICCAIAVAGLLLALALVSRALAQALMGLLIQLYGDDHNTENHTSHSDELSNHAAGSRLS